MGKAAAAADFSHGRQIAGLEVVNPLRGGGRVRKSLRAEFHRLGAAGGPEVGWGDRVAARRRQHTHLLNVATQAFMTQALPMGHSKKARGW